jgi:hypothetical protein
MNLSNPPIPDIIGWMATGVFVASYFFSKPSKLRLLQMVGSMLWMTYGIVIASKPVVAANVMVFAAAAWTVMRERTANRPDVHSVP